MSVRAIAFIDTNIMIYAHDLDAGERRDKAVILLKKLWQQERGAISTQVLQEFYVNVTRKIPQPLSPAAARAIISNYLAWPVESIDGQAVLDASQLQEKNQLSFWDALIIIAARNAGATILYSEDLSHGQVMEGVKICNPFLEAESEKEEMMPVEKAEKLFAELVNSMNAGRPELVTYKYCKKYFFDKDGFDQSDIGPVIKTAKHTEPCDVVGLGYVRLDTFIVNAKRQIPGERHFEEAKDKYDEAKWRSVLGGASIRPLDRWKGNS